MPSLVGCSVMSVSHSSLGADGAELALDEVLARRGVLQVLEPFLGPGRPWMPSSRMIRFTSLVLTISPCSISRAALTRKMP